VPVRGAETGKGKPVNTTLVKPAIIAVAGAVGVVVVAACSTSGPAAQAQRAWNDDTAACERQERTDQREACFAAAMQKYQAALKQANASSCPKTTC
jgi:hypothetical protein